MKIDVIKLGGSAVTVKDQFETLKDLSHACSLVKSYHDKRKHIVIVHGAGSFGHHQARQYKVNSGFTHLTGPDKEMVQEGFCKTRISVTKLNQAIVEQLCLHGVMAVGIPAFGWWRTDDRTVVQHNTRTIMDMLNDGFIPVLHGDCVMDNTKGGVILSGDTIIKEICKFADVDRVLFLTDVDGIFSKPPDQPDAELISEIFVTLDGKFSTNISTSGNSHFDVTGGIDLKLTTAKEIVLESHGNIRVYICNVTLTPTEIMNIDSFKGTILRLKDSESYKSTE